MGAVLQFVCESYPISSCGGGPNVVVICDARSRSREHRERLEPPCSGKGRGKERGQGGDGNATSRPSRCAIRACRSLECGGRPQFGNCCSSPRLLILPCFHGPYRAHHDRLAAIATGSSSSRRQLFCFFQPFHFGTARVVTDRANQGRQLWQSDCCPIGGCRSCCCFYLCSGWCCLCCCCCCCCWFGCAS